MTKDEALKLALEALEEAWYHVGTFQPTEKAIDLYDEARTAIKEALAQPEQEPVAMKFKIYKPTVPDPTRQGINNALLPWVYDQDRSSGFDATMWVTPVATLPPQRKPLTEGEIMEIVRTSCIGISPQEDTLRFVKAIEAAHGIKGEA